MELIFQIEHFNVNAIFKIDTFGRFYHRNFALLLNGSCNDWTVVQAK